MTDEEGIAAKEKLEKAVREYYAEIEPGVYVDSFILITHKMSVELESQGSTAVGVLAQTDQPFTLRRGMLEAALDAEKMATWG